VGRLKITSPLVWLGPGRLVEDGEVICEDDSIVSAGPRTLAEAHTELAVDGFLMPAAADRHVHIELSDPVAVLRGGVTAVRDLAWPAARIFPLADLSEGPAFEGPLIRAAGPMLTVRDGYPTRSFWAPDGTGLELADADDAVKAVGELANSGATAIKVSLNSEAGPTPDDAMLAAICDEAHGRSLPVTVHAQGQGQVERALGAGVDELAHTPWTRLSESTIQACASRMRIVSTLDILSFGRDTPEIRAALDNLRRFHQAGGTVIYGTDLGNGSVPPGIHTRELQLLAQAGLGNEEVMSSLTRAPLEPGAPADLIGLAGDPLDDLTAFEDIPLVVRAGRVVFGV
jgi:imidazolonepropionase-like amidohydrolase